MWRGKGAPLWRDPGEVPTFAELLRAELRARTDATPEEIDKYLADARPEKLLTLIAGFVTDFLPSYRAVEQRDRIIAAVKARGRPPG